MSHEAQAEDRPATFREVFESREFRAVYAAGALSWIGDYLAKAAVTALVYRETESVALSALTFALSYLPWILGGPLLATIAERHRYRTVMIICDLARMALIALVAVPGIHVGLMLALLFATSLVNAPAQAAKSALLPLILRGDRLVVGLSLNTSTSQAAQFIGYLSGAAIAPFHPRAALLIDAATFALSALIIRLGLRDRAPAMTREHRSHLLRETAEGYRMVFGTRVLRSIALLVFSAMLFAIVPEGLAAAWAADIADDERQRGLTQGLIMVANPVGFFVGGLLIGRLVKPRLRRSLIRPFAVLAPLSLVPSLFSPPVAGVAVMAAVCGFAVAGMMPAANGLFVRALPDGFRARAFGVMQSGVQTMQGLAVISTGLLAERFPLPVVVGAWSIAGVVLILAASARWPRGEEFTAAIEAATAQNGTVGRQPVGAGLGVNGHAHLGRAENTNIEVHLPGAHRGHGTAADGLHVGRHRIAP